MSGVNKHGSWVFSGGSPDIPLNLGDLYYSFDKIRDFQHALDQSGRLAMFATAGDKCILNGCEVSQGTGDTINITAGAAIVYYSVKIPDTYASFPPSVTTADMIKLVEPTAQTNLAIASATLNGVAVNYVKLAYTETNGNTRARARAAGTYAYERVPSFTLTCDTSAPTTYEVALATLVGSSGGTFTIVNTEKKSVKNTAMRGQITGGLSYYDTTHPPYIDPGDYEVHDGTLVRVVARTAVTGFIGDGTVRPDRWYYIMMNNAGSFIMQMAHGAWISKSYAITSISGGNTINFTGSAGGTQPAAGMVAVIQNATTGTNDGFWTVASVGGGGTVTSIVTDGTLMNQAGAAGTVRVYYRMSTFHFGSAGAQVHVTSTATDTGKYSPSPSDSLLGSFDSLDEWAYYDSIRNGYYSKWTGYTGYRIIGCVYVDAASHYINVISYKTARNKNDSSIVGKKDQKTSTKTGGSLIYNFSIADFDYILGNDYLVTDDSTNGHKITIFRLSQLFGTLPISLHAVSSSVDDIRVLKNNTELNLFASLANYDVSNSVDIKTGISLITTTQSLDYLQVKVNDGSPYIYAYYLIIALI